VSTNDFPSFEQPAIEIHPPVDDQPSTSSRSSDLARKLDPNNPPWGIAQSLVTWFTSVVLLAIVPLLVVMPYVLYKSWFLQQRPDNLMADKKFIVLSLLGVLPTHLLSFLVVWLVVTAAGQRPFWRTLGWSWPQNFGLWKSVFLAAGLFAFGWLILRVFGGPETQLDQLINSSYYARLITAILAVSTGPLVEELIYRGVLYSAFQRVFGMFWSVVLISLLFTAVHVYQYYKNLGVIAVIAVLSVALTLVRARTGKLLPSFVMHVVFNGIQAIFLVLQPFFEKHATEQKVTVGYLLPLLGHLLR
jgi:hypothetical protein